MRASQYYEEILRRKAKTARRTLPGRKRPTLRWAAEDRGGPPVRFAVCICDARLRRMRACPSEWGELEHAVQSPGALAGKCKKKARFSLTRGPRVSTRSLRDVPPAEGTAHTMAIRFAATIAPANHLGNGLRLFSYELEENGTKRTGPHARPRPYAWSSHRPAGFSAPGRHCPDLFATQSRGEVEGGLANGSISMLVTSAYLARTFPKSSRPF